MLGDATSSFAVTTCGASPLNRVGQAQRVIQLAIRQQPGIGGDHAATKLEHQTPVEIELQRAPVRFTRRVLK